MNLTRRAVLRSLTAAGAAANGLGPLLAQPATTDALRAPFDARKIRERFLRQRAAAACEQAVGAVSNLDGVPFYSDRNGSSTDMSRLKADVAAAAPLDQWLHAVEAANRDWLKGADGAAAECALHHLDAWAQANALMGTFNQQGDFRRKWTLGGAAISFLTLREFEGTDPQVKQRIVTWMERVAHSIMPRYERVVEKGYISSSLNNHAYWAGVAVGSVAIAANDRALFDWAMKRLDIGIGQISPDGSMPLEMRRGRLALGYHLVAFAPLATLERMAASNGRALQPAGKAAMDRLESFCIAGIEDPDRVARMVGVPQGRPESDAPPAFRDATGCEVRLGLYPNTNISALLAPVRPVQHRWLGGDVTLLWNTDAAR